MPTYSRRGNNTVTDEFQNAKKFIGAGKVAKGMSFNKAINSLESVASQYAFESKYLNQQYYIYFRKSKGSDNTGTPNVYIKLITNANNKLIKSIEYYNKLENKSGIKLLG